MYEKIFTKNREFYSFFFNIFNIINILLGRESVPELIQENCKSDIILPYISEYLNGSDAAAAQIESFTDAVAQ